jgi:phage major head subunit gpT-like protein
MMSLTNSKGRPLGLVPDLLVVPPALEAAARDILVADFINGTKNTMQGTATPLVAPLLAGNDSAWFLLCTKRPIKPLIYQQRKKAKFVSKTDEKDDNVFFSNKYIYGVDSRGNAGFGFWQMAYGSDGSAAE